MFLENRENLSNLNSRLSYLFTLPQKITTYRFLNTIGNSRSNISAHYDISNDMFAGMFTFIVNCCSIVMKSILGFLSEDMTYSCAIFPELDGDLSTDKHAQSKWSGGQSLKRLTQAEETVTPESELGSETAIDVDLSFENTNDPLYEAQIRKLQHIIDKLHIPAKLVNGDPVRLLEIGTGWGALAIRIAEQHPHIKIDTITLSSEQKKLAENRIAERGFSERICVHLMDYRNMPAEWEGRFARFVSIEMIEAVGREFLQEYWRVVDWAMEKKGAVGVVQVITIPEARKSKNLIRPKYAELSSGTFDRIRTIHSRDRLH